MAHIDYFFSVNSPWAYLAGNKLEEIAARHGAEISYRPLDVMALYDRTGGTRPTALAPGRQAYRAQDLARWSAKSGIKMIARPRFFPANPAPASYAIIAAQKAGGGDIGGLVHALLGVTWAEDRNIAEDDPIREKLSLHGFDPDLVTTGLFAGAMAYEKNLDEAEARGVFASPFYIVRETDQRFLGPDRLDFLDAHLGEIA